MTVCGVRLQYLSMISRTGTLARRFSRLRSGGSEMIYNALQAQGAHGPVKIGLDDAYAFDIVIPDGNFGVHEELLVYEITIIVFKYFSQRIIFIICTKLIIYNK